MTFTAEEKRSLIIYTNVFRKDCERKIRKIRRNKKHIEEMFYSVPESIREDEGLISPDQEIEYLKEDKAQAVIIKKKIELKL